MTLPTGTKLGPYEVLAPIGAGGMGEVYRRFALRYGPAPVAHRPAARADARSTAGLTLRFALRSRGAGSDSQRPAARANRRSLSLEI